jgi:hypothetical protein
LRLVKLLLAFLALAAPLHAQSYPTAFRALFAAGRAAPDANLVEINGRRGEPQPRAWTFLYNDPNARGGVREVVVQDGLVQSTRTPLRGFGEVSGMPVVSLPRLSVDSDRAFQIANAAAIRGRVAFHWLSYQLRARTSGHPVWTIEFINREGVAVGSTEISAETGQVLSGVGAAAGGAPVGGVIGGVRDLGVGIARDVSSTARRVAGTTQEIFTGTNTISPPPADE